VPRPTLSPSRTFYIFSILDPYYLPYNFFTFHEDNTRCFATLLSPPQILSLQRLCLSAIFTYELAFTFPRRILFHIPLNFSFSLTLFSSLFLFLSLIQNSNADKIYTPMGISGVQPSSLDTSVRAETKSGFGGLEIACWPLVPKFAGSHPAEAFGFLGRIKKILSTPSFGGEVKLYGMSKIPKCNVKVGI